MTNLNQLIKQRQGEIDTEVKSLCQYFDWEEDSEQHHEILTSLTEARRQALEDVLAGLPGSFNTTAEGYNIGYNTALQTVRAQIEELLGKIE
jgi:hypothetical protein